MKLTTEQYDQKRMLLSKYRVLLGQLQRLSEEAERWQAISEMSSSRSPGSVYCTALTIAEERDSRARLVLEERTRLSEAIARLDNPQHRLVLEGIYLSCGTQEQLAIDLDRSVRTIKRLLRSATEALDARTDFFKTTIR